MLEVRSSAFYIPQAGRLNNGNRSSELTQGQLYRDGAEDIPMFEFLRVQGHSCLLGMTNRKQNDKAMGHCCATGRYQGQGESRKQPHPVWDLMEDLTWQEPL